MSTARYLYMQELAAKIAATTDDDEAWNLYNEADRERRKENRENPPRATRWFHAATAAYRSRTNPAVST